MLLDFSFYPKYARAIRNVGVKMKPSQFIGREAEMTRLKGLLEKKALALLLSGVEDVLEKAGFFQNLEKK